MLILTRTRTDTLGRRHSVAVPLLPPPQGYDIEADFLTNNIQKSPGQFYKYFQNKFRAEQNLHNSTPFYCKYHYLLSIVIIFY